VALVGTDVSEERIANVIRVIRFGELGTKLAVTSSEFQLLVTANVFPASLILSTLMMKAIRSSETSVITRVTWRHIPEIAILHSHCREILKSFIALSGLTL
jgi:hypothetical protein